MRKLMLQMLRVGAAAARRVKRTLVRPPSYPTRPMAGLRPEDARRANLRFVAEAFEAAGVGYVVVRSQRRSSTVAVWAENRQAALTAIATAARSTTITAIPHAGESIGRHLLAADLLRKGIPTGTTVVSVFQAYAHETASLCYDVDQACDIEFWTKSTTAKRWRVAPRPNVIATEIAADDLRPVDVVDGERSYPMGAAFTRRVIDDIAFPVDAVFLWVDGEDPAWAERMTAHRRREGMEVGDASPERFRDFQELRYALRSLDMYAPWVRTVFLVTDQQVPDYLSFEDPRLVLVDHTEIADPDYLPMYNSDAIVSWIHRIPGLSEHFLYLNDDVLFCRPVKPSLFFHPSGLLKLFPSTGSRPFGPVVDGEPAAMAKAKVTRRRIEERYGVTLSNIMRHTPHPMTQSMMRLLEDEFPDAVEYTRRSHFRRLEDMPPDQMVHYVSQIIGAGTRAPINYSYVNIGLDSGAEQLERVLSRKDRDVLCLNDAPEDPSFIPDVERIRALLEDAFPVRSRWETPGR